MRQRILFLLILGIGIIATYLYLTPATPLLFTTNRSYILSAGSDSLTSPFQASTLTDIIRTTPLSFFHVSLENKRCNAPENCQNLYGWLERLLLWAGAQIFSFEQAHNFQIHILVLINIFLFFLYARKRAWPAELSLALAFCFTLSPFIRARAVVHPMYVAVFPAVAILLAFDYLKNEGLKKSALIKATLLLLLVAISPQYTQLCLYFLSPIFLYYLLVNGGKSTHERLLALAISAIPSFLLVIYSYWGTKNIPISPLASMAPADLSQQFWHIFSANPLEYLTGDLYSDSDWNPLRWSLRSSFSGFDHEHANGIRWTLLALLPLALWNRKESYPKETYIFLLLMFFSFWCSLGPAFYSPAGLLHWAFPDFRVANRFAPLVALSLLLIVGDYLAKKWNHISSTIKIFGFCFILFEFFPLTPLPTMKVPELPSALQTPGCGSVIALPYMSSIRSPRDFNMLTLMLSNSDCALVNRASYQDFPNSYIETLSRKDLDCLGVRWIFNLYRDQKLCKKFGAIQKGETLCEIPNSQLARPLQECLLRKY